jgi:nucleoside-diphosphate-sugar epimerase/NADPH:quinone reductase-like Zn-dependent oxidoreductase/3-oxoacyl-(acyl-carrier-protein) synthase/malonyl CoA-acyl carrier protein transacylase/arylamine N-acetyltransferase
VSHSTASFCPYKLSIWYHCFVLLPSLLGLVLFIVANVASCVAVLFHTFFDSRTLLRTHVSHSSHNTPIRQACQDIRSGKCNMAVVAGSNCILDPRITRVFEKMKLVCSKSVPIPACKVFCDSADGYVRKEAVVVMVLSSRTRVQAEEGGCYAEVVGHKSMTGSGESITTPSRDAQLALYNSVSNMAKPFLPDNSTVQYVECHGSGTRVGDAVEISVLADVIKSRSPSVFSRAGRPLDIGSVKSNIGHTEASCGLVALLKALLALEHGQVPPNLHYSREHSSPRCNGLDDETLHVVTNPTPINGDAVVAINSFGFGGTYVQVLVKGMSARTTKSVSFGAVPAADHYEPWKNINPLLGRTVACARKISNAVKEHSFSKAIAPPNCGGGIFSVRAFTTPVEKRIFTRDEAQSQSAHPRVWLVFAGNGGVWPDMCRELFGQSHIFRNTFLQCDLHLKAKWTCDSLSRLQAWWQKHPQDSFSEPSSLQNDGWPMQNIVDAGLALVAVQLCLIDLLKTVGMTRDKCDGFVGHSLGEVAAGYFDECYDRNTALDIALLRSRMASDVAGRGPGAMCVVEGISREKVEELINEMREEGSPEVACHTGTLQVTLSGTVSELQAVKNALRDRQGVSVLDLETFGAAFHSRLILEDDLKKLQSELTQVFGAASLYRPQRSGKWKSTCFEALDPDGANVDTGYHCQGARGCVEFARAITSIPKEAIVVMCGPRALFRSVLTPRRCLSLLHYKKNAVETLATVYGELFLHGVPLSGGTEACLSPREVFGAPSQRAMREKFLAWDHQEEFPRFLTPPQPQPQPPLGDYFGLGCNRFVLDLAGKDSWLRSHKVAGRHLIPAAAYIYIISRGISRKLERSCILKDFRVHFPIKSDDVDTLCLGLDVHRLVQLPQTEDSRKVVVFWDNQIVASCIIQSQDDFQMREPDPLSGDFGTASMQINPDAAYNQLGRHGYEYGIEFRALAEVSPDKTQARIRSTKDRNLQLDVDLNAEMKAFILTLDAMLQLLILNHLGESQFGDCLLPVNIKQVHLTGQLPHADGCFARLLQINDKKGNSVLDGCCSVQVDNFAALTLDLEELKRGEKSLPEASSNLLLNELCWEPLPPGPSDADVGNLEHKFTHTVHALSNKVDFEQWKLQVLQLRNSSTGNTSHTLLVSCAPGFAGFLRSLQQEPGFEHLRGLQVLPCANSEAICLALLDHRHQLVSRARAFFARHKQVCLLVKAQLRADGDQVELLVEKTLAVERATFPAKHGVFLALSPNRPETFNNWKPIGCLLDTTADDGKVETCTVQVAFASINFRDVMVGMGKLERSKALTGYGRESGGLGLDFAGVVHSSPSPVSLARQQQGKQSKVIGLGRNCIASTLPCQPKYLCWELEEQCDLEQYATVPCAYATAYYALCVHGRLRATHKVLVHCGAGGVGQAALHLCKSRLGIPASQLFVTCGTPAKQSFVRSVFEIPAENIGDSRSRDFVRMVMKQTNGEGVDLVLNSLARDLVEASVSCLSFGGMLLELGKAELAPSVMQCLRHNDRHLALIDLDQVMACQSRFEAVHTLLDQGLKSGEVKPLYCKVFSAPKETKEAYHFMSSEDRIGKVLLRIEQDNLRATDAPLSTLVDWTQLQRTQHVIVIVGGFGGLGLCLSQLFAVRFGCACKFVLCTRQRESLPVRRRHIDSLRSRFGVTVEVFQGNLAQPTEAERLLASVHSEDTSPKLLWIFNLAAATQDALFERMHPGSWDAPFQSKVGVTNALCQALDDERFADIAACLHQFVCFSSVVAGEGNRGQTNYATANCAMEQIIQDRVKAGKVALCVRLGLVQYTGLATSPNISAECTHLRSLRALDAMWELERLFVRRAQGIYTLCGTELVQEARAEPNGSSHKDLQHAIVDCVRDLHPGTTSADNNVLLNTPLDTMLDSLSMVYLWSMLRMKVRPHIGSEHDLLRRTPLQIAALYSAPESSSPHRSELQAEHKEDPTSVSGCNVVVILTLGRTAITSHANGKQLSEATRHALNSVYKQTVQPKVVLVVFEVPHDAEDPALVEEVKLILPLALTAGNCRTGSRKQGQERHNSARFGSINTGVVHMCHESSLSLADHSCWIAILDANSVWRPNHLAQCLSAAGASPDACCKMVVATGGLGPSACSLEEALVYADRSTLLVRHDVLLEAGMFDEAFGDESLGGFADADLYIRLYEILAGGTKSPGVPWLAISGLDTVHTTVKKTKGNQMSDAELFVYKYHNRLSPQNVQSLLVKAGLAADSLNLHTGPVPMPECKPVQLEMWNGEGVCLRHDTHNVLSAAAEDNVLPPKSSAKMLVGVITSNPLRLCGLIRDLGCALDSSQHCVVVFANSQDVDLPDAILGLMQGHSFRRHVIRITDRIVLELNGNQSKYPLAIAQGRTTLQTFLAATTDAEAFDAVAVIDDDMRLPRAWGVRDGDGHEGDILLSRAIKTPPNPTAMSMRTQLLDFVYALDSMYAKASSVKPPLSNNAWQCPSFEVYHNSLHDQYYDLSSARWNHLEVPRRFECSVDRSSLVKVLGKRILLGDPLAREAVSVEHGPSLQRGGCMVLPKKSFHLLRTAHEAPTVQLASGRQAVSRRSDSFWVQKLHENGGKVAVVRRHLAVLHDNTHDLVPSPRIMREVVALEMVGAILCRPVEDREAFVHHRTGALRCSSARIRGLCKTLRGRDYFDEVPDLEEFLRDLEERFSEVLWRQEVHDVVDKHLRQLRNWEAHRQPEAEGCVSRTYCLDVEERKFLNQTDQVAQAQKVENSQSHINYPNASELRSFGSTAPIPCLHRIHTGDDRVLRGAQRVQARIGMSLPLEEVEQRLRQLAQLHQTLPRHARHDLKALVTVDDGFRDVLLLRPVFRELSQYLQPVLFVPSGLLMEQEEEHQQQQEDLRDSVRRRHLPLTCLYTHCSALDIDPEDQSKLGNATRLKLKTLPEKQQYERLEEAGIATDCPTDDLLTSADLDELAGEGWWIGTHGPDHSDLTKSPAFHAVVIQRLQQDVQLLKRRNWAPWFAWPEGVWCARIADALTLQECGLTAQFGLSSLPLGEPEHASVLRRVAWVGASRKERVLVTGGRGFLGQHLCLLLQSYGFDVFSFDLADGQDILDRKALTAELRDNKITACVHLAAVADLYEAASNPVRAEKINVEGTEGVLSCCDACSVRVLFASTCCAYGNNGVSVNDELAPLAPTELYAQTKVRGEKLVLESPRLHELKHVIMRLATFYGPGMRGALATSVFLEAAVSGRAIQIHGTGEQTRCYTHVHDIAEGIRVILQSQFAGVINVSDDRPCSVNQLAQIIMNAAGCTVKVSHVHDRDGQIQRSSISNKRLRALGNHGWSPSVTLATGLEQCARLTKMKNGAKSLELFAMVPEHKLTSEQKKIPATGHCTRFNEKYLREKENNNGQGGSFDNFSGRLPIPLPFDNLDPLPGITVRINNRVFEVSDPSIWEFFREHGFAVVRGISSPKQIEQANEALDKMLHRQFEDVRELAEDQIPFDDFAAGVSQLRNLFLDKDDSCDIFRELVYGQGQYSLSRMAQKAMSTVDPNGNWNGIKLLHDHIIKKPPGLSSKTIPLHQDTMFWPVDIPGCSTWTVLTEATLDCGCLEILDLASKPHLYQQNPAPVDFMSEEVSSGLRIVLEKDPHPTRYLLPMRAGDTGLLFVVSSSLFASFSFSVSLSIFVFVFAVAMVFFLPSFFIFVFRCLCPVLFSSHTWHRSSPNGRQDLTRTAYIQTWTHPDARWRPDLVPWHPVNEHLEKTGYKPNMILGGSHHPVLNRAELEGKHPQLPRSIYMRQSVQLALSATKETGQSISMFDASDVVTGQIRNILLLRLGESRAGVLNMSLVDMLKDATRRSRIVKCTVLEAVCDEKNNYLVEESGCLPLEERLMWVLKQLLLSAAAYASHRSRNVFNSAYSAWWTLAGEGWNKKLLDGPFESEYVLSKGDVSRFLTRIRVHRERFDDQLGLLRAIITGVFEHIPFQNFTMLTRVHTIDGAARRCTPTLGEIISDMVSGIGGLCSTRNPFLFLLLKALNFQQVEFLSGTMCLPSLGKTRDNMHIALAVRVGNNRYWVDVANGFPYVKPISLDSDAGGCGVIEHPFVHTQLDHKGSDKNGIVIVKHLFLTSLGNNHWGSAEWMDNYCFSPIPVQYADFGPTLEKLYDCTADYGPFLKNLRFNLWTADGGLVLRNQRVSLVKHSVAHPLAVSSDLDLWGHAAGLKFQALCSTHGFPVSEELAQLLPQAWIQCKLNEGSIEPVEDITITGGFFDNSPNAFLGRVTVWRGRQSGKVMALTFRKLKEYKPEKLPVVNKGFAGGSWFQDKLYVCWPNRLAEVDPASDWKIVRHLDNAGFNDLHHVHACKEGLWVANTGMDSVDYLDWDFQLRARISVVAGAKEDGKTDVRSQVEHDSRRGKDKEHVNFVTVEGEEQKAGGGTTVTATLLQSKRIVRVHKEQPLQIIAQLSPTSPPHEGFMLCSRENTRWNSTVDGFIVESNSNTGEVVRRWDLSLYPDVPRGWTRGLCVLRDGFLVGSTVVRDTAENWLDQHQSDWNFDVKNSRTAVLFVPFHPKDGDTRSVDVMTGRKAKIYSILKTPDNVVVHQS